MILAIKISVCLAIGAVILCVAIMESADDAAWERWVEIERDNTRD